MSLGSEIDSLHLHFPDGTRAPVFSAWPLEAPCPGPRPSSATSLCTVWDNFPRPVPQFLHLRVWERSRVHFHTATQRTEFINHCKSNFTVCTLLNKCFIPVHAFLFLSQRQHVFCILLKESKLTLLSVSSYFMWKHFHKSALYSDSLSWLVFLYKYLLLFERKKIFIGPEVFVEISSEDLWITPDLFTLLLS